MQMRVTHTHPSHHLVCSITAQIKLTSLLASQVSAIKYAVSGKCTLTGRDAGGVSCLESEPGRRRSVSIALILCFQVHSLFPRVVIVIDPNLY